MILLLPFFVYSLGKPVKIMTQTYPTPKLTNHLAVKAVL